MRSRCSNQSRRPGTSRSQSRSGNGFDQILSVPMFSLFAWSTDHFDAAASSARATTHAHSDGSMTASSESATAPAPVG